MDYYTQPPAIIRVASQDKVVPCETVLENVRKFIPQRYTFERKPDNENLRFFEDSDRLTLERTVHETDDDLYTVVNRTKISHHFYKDPSSKKDWVLALNYRSDNKKPRGIYALVGEVNGQILTKHDLIFYFDERNSLDVTSKNFKLGQLKMYTSRVVYNCNAEIRKYLNGLFAREKTKGK
ncbi:hypothetical protein HYW20_01880 [Candidatus Woesearchaeota archaeon]|nr:hypothetical protein [Candidatus Woesearchaeota archaeon]